jgi:hypothetical protein
VLDDLEAMVGAGALRAAPDTLRAAARDAVRPGPERDIAAAALSRLYAYAQVVSE